MKTFFIIISLVFSILFLPYNLNGQEQNCSGTNDSKALKLYKEALKKSKISRNVAEDLLFQAIQFDQKYTDAYFLLGVIYFEKAEKKYLQEKLNYQVTETDKLCRKAFRKSLKLCEEFSQFESYRYLGISYYYTKEYVESKYYLELYIGKSKDFIKVKETELLLQEIIEYMKLVDNPVKFKPIPVKNINTEKDEYLPLLSPDGDYIFFTRKFVQDADNYSEVFMSAKRLNAKNEPLDIFTSGTELKYPFNDGRNQGASTVTADNNTMYMTICSIEKGAYNSYKNCDIYATYRLKGQWDKLTPLDKNINNKSSFESQPSVTADGNTLYFASAREAGFGEIDLYRSVKDENGNWTKAENLGAVINTEGDDKTPFIHPDGKTLYFASNSRPGMGGFDVYFSKYDSILGWSEPKNLGYPINTKDDELAFCISADGTKIFFSSNKMSKDGNWDIFTTSLPDEAKPQQVILFKGKIFGDDGDSTSNADLILTSIATKKETHGKVEEGTGNYAVSIKVEKNEKFILSAEKEGYFYHTEYIDPDEEKYIPPSQNDIEVKKIIKNIPREISNVYFDIDSSDLSDTAQIALNSLFRFLKINPTMKIQILGHTDNTGSDYHNNKLAYDRASKVAEYLIQKGVNEKRIKILSYGESKPFLSNESESGRMFNRRVEFIVK
jgi:outer membrane protein OmpA-like peptidoglycan-associated protein